MTPEQIEEAVARLEALPEELTSRINKIGGDTNLSAAGRESGRAELRESYTAEVDDLEAALSEALGLRLSQLRAEIADEQRRYFEVAPEEGGGAEAATIGLLRSIDGRLGRADLRERWRLLSGREILALYQEVLASDERALVELCENEAPRLLAERGDSESETALRTAVAQARQMRTTERLETLNRAVEAAEVRQLRFRNAMALARDLLRTA